MRIVNHREIKGRATVGNEKGQTLIEYGLILLLMAIVVVLMLKTVGQTTCNTYNTIMSSVKSAARQ